MKNVLLFIVHFFLIAMLSIIPILIILGAIERDPYYTAWIFLSVFLSIGALLYFATIVSKLINKGKTQTLEEKRYAEYWNNVKVNIPK
ncbi:TPA: hypothetical protein RS720_002231 [Mannheimia haemolytica]|uniref:hypothetical protein n=1 Tax=Mannheimia haemolytica TaxID=75985 RepID=UPI00094B4D40|nr:hypothetical protein [Mannheimia haemolytica]HDL5111558.1 hypothetical protein [Mannheimia haemolytica]HDL5237097.1 hypothetical protein [Mannheimia haemolytica]HDL5341876.1 hypothetical protein [Mannheimia haemolytica]HDL5351509.1 hypothetical protein [Mannheimia haemolytica]HDL5354447.1 hypothetical protein [Mannheimia haemolytica]